MTASGKFPTTAVGQSMRRLPTQLHDLVNTRSAPGRMSWRDPASGRKPTNIQDQQQSGHVNLSYHNYNNYAAPVYAQCHAIPANNYNNLDQCPTSISSSYTYLQHQMSAPHHGSDVQVVSYTPVSQSDQYMLLPISAAPMTSGALSSGLRDQTSQQEYAQSTQQSEPVQLNYYNTQTSPPQYLQQYQHQYSDQQHSQPNQYQQPYQSSNTSNYFGNYQSHEYATSDSASYHSTNSPSLDLNNLRYTQDETISCHQQYRPVPAPGQHAHDETPPVAVAAQPYRTAGSVAETVCSGSYQQKPVSTHGSSTSKPNSLIAPSECRTTVDVSNEARFRHEQACAAIRRERTASTDTSANFRRTRHSPSPGRQPRPAPASAPLAPASCAVRLLGDARAAGHREQPAGAAGASVKPLSVKVSKQPVKRIAGADSHGTVRRITKDGIVIARRKNATREITAILKCWLEMNRNNPYPSKCEKGVLSCASSMTGTQVSTWFANARRRMKKEEKLCSKHTSCKSPQLLCRGPKANEVCLAADITTRALNKLIETSAAASSAAIDPASVSASNNLIEKLRKFVKQLDEFADKKRQAELLGSSSIISSSSSRPNTSSPPTASSSLASNSSPSILASSSSSSSASSSSSSSSFSRLSRSPQNQNQNYQQQRLLAVKLDQAKRQQQQQQPSSTTGSANQSDSTTAIDEQ